MTALVSSDKLTEMGILEQKIGTPIVALVNVHSQEILEQMLSLLDAR